MGTQVEGIHSHNGYFRDSLSRQLSLAVAGEPQNPNEITLRIVDGHLMVVPTAQAQAQAIKAKPRRRKPVTDGRTRNAKVARLVAHMASLVKPGEESAAYAFFASLVTADRAQYAADSGVSRLSDRTWLGFLRAIYLPAP